MDKSRYCSAELRERIDFSEDLACFRFEPEEQLEFEPGQYATLGLEEDDRMILRPYSVVSAPHEEYLEVFVELVPNGALSTKMWEMEPPDEIYIRRRIVGLFTLDEEQGRTKHLMAATVTGVAPYVSMVRAIQKELDEGKREEPPELLLVHGASRSWEMGTYREELEEVSGDGWLTYVPTVSRPWEDEEWEGEIGRVGDVIRKHADAYNFTASNAIAYTCGHPGMIDTVKSILRRCGFEKDYLKEEKYFV